MDKSTKNYLYRNPEFYALFYPDEEGTTPTMCEQIFERYADNPVESILDLGCGIGRDIAALSLDNKRDCVGVDYLETMIEICQRSYPHLPFQQGDIRNIRLEKKFDAILCLGWAFNYMLSFQDIDKALMTIAAHAKNRSLFIMEILSGISLLKNPGEILRTYFNPVDEQHPLKAKATFEISERDQLLIRHREWQLPDNKITHDFVKFRLFFPGEISYMLHHHGFSVLDIFSNKKLEADDELQGESLYIIAQKLK